MILAAYFRGGLRGLLTAIGSLITRSRGERSRPECGHSVSGGQPNDDENRVVLLAAAVHDGHGRPWIHRKTRGPNLRGRARVVSRRRFLKWGAAYEMGDIVEGRAVGEFP